MEKPDFWDNQQNAVEVQVKASQIKEDIDKVSSFKSKLVEIKEVYTELGGDDSIQEELIKTLHSIKKDVLKEELLQNFSGKFDKGGAVIEASAGVGGRDAEDFTAMLLRMYQRFAERKNFTTKLLSVSYGEAGGPDSRTGIKNFCLEINGLYAFGYLKDDSGSHRLVRQSPFSSSSLRHTSFAQIEVFPIIKESNSSVVIKDEELSFDTFRSSGPGGQNVNKRETAVRVTHIPTGVTASSQAGRMQGENKKVAIELLRAKLEKIHEEEEEKRRQEIKGDTPARSWGTQIRNYVLHPYKLVKNLKTGKETSNVEEVLDGNIDLIKNDIL